jgi:hypothetical protein
VPVPHQTPPPGITFFAGGSQYRAVALASSGLDILTDGLADQPAVNYPAWTPAEAAAYKYINKQLGITVSGGIRFEYTNQYATNALAGYYAKLVNFAPDPNVPLAAWNAVDSEIQNELSSVLDVYQVFHEIDGLDNAVLTRAGKELKLTKDLVNLSSGGQNSVFGIFLEQVFSAALAGIAKAATGGAGVAASVLVSGITSAIGDLTKGQSDQVFNTTYYQLKKQIFTLETNTSSANSNTRAAILSAPNRFLPVGAAINNRTLDLPVGSKKTLAKNADNAFKLYFLEVLAPLRFAIRDIYNYPDYLFNPSGPHAYDQYFVHDTNNNYYGSLYELLSGVTTFSPAYASKELVSDLLTLTGATQGELLTTGLGLFTVYKQPSEP